ncbi:CopL family metal-binding regulatory protein [Vulcaniibacterium gelatinicum]|uniref:CopL family metal-binding regulatory protein n=1 Tax=Vulcaniibacterium gelatinicum TaxID=2598725 RepID=UPI0011CB17C4|nr:CopL family metal-binding regulatory protein [Vulcaniibacterium gelatinicum]
MSPVSIALRLLLSLCLVLNGVGTALAGVHVPMFHEAPEAAMLPATATRAELPCHGYQAAQAAAPSDVASIPSGRMAAEPESPVGDDCCAPGSCQCACIHLAQAMLPPPAPAATVLVPARSTRPLPPGRAAPPLPHLIRPPIA